MNFVMPFSLTNAPTTFQSLMNVVFRPYLMKFILIFFDDILVYSCDSTTHKQHLRATFLKLQEHQLYLKKSKCVFRTDKVNYLGHVIQKGGVVTDSQKITVVVDWPIPVNNKQLRSFLGLAGYYKRFIGNYRVISKPFTELLKKEGFKWNEKAIAAFEEVKTTLIQAPVLALPSPDK